MQFVFANLDYALSTLRKGVPQGELPLVSSDQIVLEPPFMASELQIVRMGEFFGATVHLYGDYPIAPKLKAILSQELHSRGLSMEDNRSGIYISRGSSNTSLASVVGSNDGTCIHSIGIGRMGAMPRRFTPKNPAFFYKQLAELEGIVNLYINTAYQAANRNKIAHKERKRFYTIVG